MDVPAGLTMMKGPALQHATHLYRSVSSFGPSLEPPSEDVGHLAPLLALPTFPKIDAVRVQASSLGLSLGAGYDGLPVLVIS